MSTTQDHTSIAAELTDVFGPGAGESGTLGNQGSSGETGSTGSPVFQAVNVIGQGVNVLKTKKAMEAINNVLSNPNATRADLQGVLAQGKSAKYTAKSMATLGDIATGVGYAGAAENVLGGKLGTGGSAAVTALKTNPYVGMASGVGSLLGKYDPINPALNKGAGLLNKLPPMKYANQALTHLGERIRKIPGTGTASLIAGGLSEFPDEILSVPAKIWRSFGDKAKAAAKSSREFALNDMFEEYAKNDPYSTPPGGWVGSRVVPGGYGEGQYNEVISFQAETEDLWEEYKNTDSYKTVLTAQQGIRGLEEIRGQEALKKLQNDRAISELTDPVQNIVPVSDHAEFGMGTHYADEYGTWDVDTGEKLNVPDLYEPALPVLEPIPFDPTQPLEVYPPLTALQLHEHSKWREWYDQFPPPPETQQSHDPSLPNYIVTPGPSEEPQYEWWNKKDPLTPPEPVPYGPQLPQYEPPTADPYQAPAIEEPQYEPVPYGPQLPPTASEVEPRVLPEEIVTPRIMTPRRIHPTDRPRGIETMRKQPAEVESRVLPEEIVTPRETESWRKNFRYASGMPALPPIRLTTAYEELRKKLSKQAADEAAARNHAIASNGYAAPGMGWSWESPLGFSTSTNTGLAAQTKPKHNLRELPTGLNASSY